DAAYHFPGESAEESATLTKVVESTLPKKTFIGMPLDQLLAYEHKAPDMPRVKVSLAPPPIYYSDVPAILVIYMGTPQFRPVQKQNDNLMFAVNTNWPVFLDTVTSQYYLLNGDSWLTAPDAMKGPWRAAETLPQLLSELPAGSNWDEIRKNVPGKIATS